MASATGLPFKSVAFTAAFVFAMGASRVNARKLILNICTGPGSYGRIFAVLTIFANLKNIPFAWHFRVFNAILRHCIISLPRIPPAIATSTLFLPVITTSHSPLWECDYNLHKSNSTYFSDLDVSRSHLVCALFQPGIDRLHHNDREKLVIDPKTGQPAPGRWGVMLGSVMCSFKREIGIYQPFEMWSRLLCWDRKWIYVITHFVKKGAVKPSAYILTDGSWFEKGYKTVKGDGKQGTDIDEKAIFASAISKYVVKLGRLTVHPEVLMAASGMLPERPGGWATMAGVSEDSTPEILQPETIESTSEITEWDWKRVEAEKKKGLSFAEHFAALDELSQEFTGSQEPALGKYRDFLI